MILNIDDYMDRELLLATAKKFSVNNILEHEIRVADFSMMIFDTIQANFNMSHNSRNLLYYASMLHDLGYFIEKDKHHKHSKYIILTDPAFKSLPIELKMYLSIMVASHKKKLDKNIYMFEIKIQEELIKLISILRIADALDHKHNLQVQLKDIYIKQDKLNLNLNGEKSFLILDRFNKKSELFKTVFPLDIELNIS
ncbi:HD domain-containing protein [Clostridium intestinale]|uniref:HD domain-containing protein n=1 Tax=Clostridium intestinale TaxID=36845 RepID=A0A7D6W055_9CLOT|nr:HD domain-containing protein [Clostridium intestinale]QLY79771.1 HD domain-containing protein [Clostridium intestinale]